MASRPRGRPEWPPILSLVFYTGGEKWGAPTSLDELIQKVPDAPEGLDLWSYRLIDVQRHALDKLVGSDSPLLGLFQLEQIESPDDLAGTASELRAVLGPEDEELSDAFVALINEVVFPKLTLPGGRRLWITGLEEVPSMLAQRIERITDGWEMKGRAEGEAKGRAELFLELFAAKFGDAPTQVRERLTGLSKEQLETWAKRLLWAERPEEVFDD